MEADATVNGMVLTSPALLRRVTIPLVGRGACIAKNPYFLNLLSALLYSSVFHVGVGRNINSFP
ncbi:MAG: hypothetical protein J0M05_03400 [Candidatus Kapabacteria bacterium]|nr:hypothetical protein [Candidatus Kapabacteria bacterium]